MSEHIQLTEQWGLRKLQLGDRCEWTLQYLGMDWIRMSEFLPSKNAPNIMDDDIRKFAAAVAALSPPEPTEGQVRSTALEAAIRSWMSNPSFDAAVHAAINVVVASRSMPLQDRTNKGE